MSYKLSRAAPPAPPPSPTLSSHSLTHPFNQSRHTTQCQTGTSRRPDVQRNIDADGLTTSHPEKCCGTERAAPSIVGCEMRSILNAPQTVWQQSKSAARSFSTSSRHARNVG
eukprot:scaffold12688_cov146-Isochrysis_galbana.AAC.3